MKLKNMRIDEVSMVDKAANKKKYALMKREVPVVKDEAAEKAKAEADAKAKAEADRVAAEKVAAEKLALEKAAAEKAAFEKAEADRVAKEKAEAEETEALLAVNKDIRSVMEIIEQL